MIVLPEQGRAKESSLDENQRFVKVCLNSEGSADELF